MDTCMLLGISRQLPPLVTLDGFRQDQVSLHKHRFVLLLDRWPGHCDSISN